MHLITYSHTNQTYKKNFIYVGLAALEKYDHKHRDTIHLYILLLYIYITIIIYICI